MNRLQLPKIKIKIINIAKNKLMNKNNNKNCLKINRIPK